MVTRPRPSPGLYDRFCGLYTPRQMNTVGQYLEEELQRSQELLSRPGHPKVCFLSYLLRNERRETVRARLGAIAEHRVDTRTHVFCDVRVGSYRYDQVAQGGLEDNAPEDESVRYIEMPTEVSEDAYRVALWRLTEARYREAAVQYYARKSDEVHYVDEARKLPARRRMEGERHGELTRYPELDVERWHRVLKRASALLRGTPDIQVAEIELSAWHRQQRFVSTEGANIAEQRVVYDLHATFWMLAPGGYRVEQEVSFVTGDAAELPDEKGILALVRERIKLLRQIATAPHLPSYTGPVLLAPVPAGLFFHEVIGHRLEGSRLLSSDEGATFANLRNKAIAPSFVDIVDDPTLTHYGDRSLIGAFLYDDEGVRAKRANLVERGVLQGFLTTRTPIPGQRELNGHARASRHERPISRMGNLMVSSRDPKGEDEMFALFLEEIRRRKLPYGIHVLATLGGETDTRSYDFQAFKGEIMHAERVTPDGERTLCRGVDFVGTPLSALDALVALGDDVTVDNAYCGAESGMIPVSTVCPSALMSSLELQSKDRQRFAPFALPPPPINRRP
ncbi:MAG: TldD/PmbA family protein [Polyangiales bacterium]